MRKLIFTVFTNVYWDQVASKIIMAGTAVGGTNTTVVNDTNQTAQNASIASGAFAPTIEAARVGIADSGEHPDPRTAVWSATVGVTLPSAEWIPGATFFFACGDWREARNYSALSSETPPLKP